MVTLVFFVDHIFDSIPPMILLLRQPILPAKIQMPQHRPEYFALPELHLSACSKGYRPLSVEVVGCHAGKIPLTSQTVHGAITTVLLDHTLLDTSPSAGMKVSALFVGYIYMYIYIYIAQKDNFLFYSLIPFSSWLNPSIAFKIFQI